MVIYNPRPFYRLAYKYNQNLVNCLSRFTTNAIYTGFCETFEIVPFFLSLFLGANTAYGGARFGGGGWSERKERQ